MLRKRIVTLLCTGLAVGLISLAVAAPPKTAGSKKKSADNDAGTTEAAAAKDNATDNAGDDDTQKKVVKTDAEWRKILTREQFRVARGGGTELAFGPAYRKFKKEREGTYQCVCCGQTLFESKTKFESRTGWPSFYDPIDPKVVTLLDDISDGTLRTEVECSRCDGHLGHVFSDGPAPTGLRYCMNYASLKFVPKVPPGDEAKSSSKDDKPKEKPATKAKGSKARESD